MKKLLVIVFAALAQAPSLFAAQHRADLLVRHATIVDVEQARLIPDHAVAIAGDRIVAVGKDADLARSWSTARKIDAQKRFMIPGLWDMHVHFGGGQALVEENRALLPLYVAHGVTTVRDASGDLSDEVLSWRRAIAAGSLFGPTLFTSGPKIEGIAPIWKGTLEAGSEAEVDKAIERLKTLRVDFVKITDNTLEPELFLYAVRQARAAGLRASGHIPLAITVPQAVDAGLSSIEHLDYAYNAGVKDEAAIAADFGAGRITREQARDRQDAGFDRKTAMDAYRQLAKKGVSVTPTLNGSRIIAWLDRDDHWKEDFLAYIGPGLRKTYEWRIQRAAQASAEQIAQRHAHYERMADVLPMLQEAGVTIMAGTDAGYLNSFNYPGIGLHDELALFVDEGLTPAQALTSATRAGPAWFGLLDKYGSIEAGKAADLVLLDRNPLEDIRATRAIHTVILRGTVQDRAALDRMLADTRAKVAAWDGASAQPEFQVLFVCEHGNVKSLMAASYFNWLASQRKLPYRAVSRGSAPNSTRVPPAIVAGLQEDGIDVAAFHPAAVETADIEASRQLVLINTELPASTTGNGISTERWTDVPPASVNFEAARDSLKAHVAQLMDQLTRVGRD